MCACSTGRHEAKGFVAPEKRSVVEQCFGLCVGVRVRVGESMRVSDAVERWHNAL